VTVHVTSWVLRNSRATLGSRLVLLVLADYADEDGGSCWPSVATIARESLLSERQVQYCLRHLEQLGEIEVAKGGGRRSNRYRVLMGRGANSAPVRGAVDCTPGVQPIAPDPPIDPPVKKTLAATPRKRNKIWDALTYVFGEPTTKTATQVRGKVCASLTQAGATPDQVVARASAWPAHFDSAVMTDLALEKHWDTLGRRPLRRR
jgi:hypothetical protein